MTAVGAKCTEIYLNSCGTGSRVRLWLTQPFVLGEHCRLFFLGEVALNAEDGLDLVRGLSLDHLRHGLARQVEHWLGSIARSIMDVKQCEEREGKSSKKKGQATSNNELYVVPKRKSEHGSR